MSFDGSSPIQELAAAKEDGDEPAPMAQTNDDQTRRESSDDDMPIMTRRQLREPAKDKDSIAVRERRPVRENARDSGEYTSRPTPRQPSKPSPKKTGKGYKKPGPTAWAAKPIMKNDMKAKRAVIREIEGYWGRGFIKSYIPKCHRPLVKRGKHGKRAMFRDHETDPKKWLPSVLKAILMIAKLTNNKKWLKDAMNDVVRYRIKHTGNRKPQLVTTDFDVIEDMLVKQWDVEYAFGIRYKHLLVNRKDQEETDEDIDHILQAGSDQDDGSEGENDNSDDDLEDQDEDDDEDEEDEDDDLDQGHGGISGKYLQSSGYTKAPQYPSPTLPRQQAKIQKHQKPLKQTRVKSEPKQTPPPPQQQQTGMYGYGAQMHGYGPPMDPWGRPMPPYGGPNSYGGYGGYGGYSGYDSYGPPQYSGKDGRQGSQQPPPYGMYPPPHPMTPAPSIPDTEHRGRRASPFAKNKRGREDYEQTPSFGMGRPDFQMHGHPSAYQGGSRPKIKRESPAFDERTMSMDDFDGPTNDLGLEDDATENSAAVDAEVEAAELELKLARLRAKQAMMKKSK